MKKLEILFVSFVLFICFVSCETERVDPAIETIEESIAEEVFFEGAFEKGADRSVSSSGCGVIGPRCANPGQILNYTYTNNLPNINWTVDSGNISIISGQGTQTVTLSFGSGFSGGQISVVGGNPGSTCTVILQIPRCLQIDPCASYWLGITDGYIDGTGSGSNTVYLNASGNFPAGTTYSWRIERQNGDINIYAASTQNPREVAASLSNKIVKATVTATFSSCTKTATHTFFPPIPN